MACDNFLSARQREALTVRVIISRGRDGGWGGHERAEAEGVEGRSLVRLWTQNDRRCTCEGQVGSGLLPINLAERYQTDHGGNHRRPGNSRGRKQL